MINISIDIQSFFERRITMTIKRTYTGCRYCEAGFPYYPYGRNESCHCSNCGAEWEPVQFEWEPDKLEFECDDNWSDPYKGFKITEHFKED
jgi:hypothetical protein